MLPDSTVKRKDSCSGRLTGEPESAGINRHVVGEEESLQERK
jgi:hypothetical protein